jgi:PAS domain-containing protein
MMITAHGSRSAPIAQPITLESQPELWQLVHDASARLGVPAPAEISIYPLPDVQVQSGRILIGLPLVLDLPADELAAMIAHELFHQAALGGHSAYARDSVAHVVSPESMAGAVVRGTYLALTFQRFVLQYVGPLAVAGWYPVDLWAAWRWVLQQDSAAPETAPGVRPVPLRPLGFETEAGFAKLLAEQLSNNTELKALTFDAVPEEIWEEAAAMRVIRIREAAAELLGHPVVLPFHVLGLVQAGQSAEILRRCGAESPDLFPVSRVLGPMVADALRRRGYRHENILRQHVFTGPSFDRIDVHALIDPIDRGEPTPPKLLEFLK